MLYYLNSVLFTSLMFNHLIIQFVWQKYYRYTLQAKQTFVMVIIKPCELINITYLLSINQKVAIIY